MSAPKEARDPYENNNNMDAGKSKTSLLSDNLIAGYGSFSQKKGAFSPNRNEIAHMRPSNNFEDITEDEFNKREQNKKQY